MRRGIATFGLDYGRCPPWLFERMVRLARSIAILMVENFGPEVFFDNKNIIYPYTWVCSLNRCHAKLISASC
jgi:hypothetical protein